MRRRIAIITGVSGGQRWTHGALIADLIRRFESNDVACALFCDAAEDPAIFDGASELSVMRPYEHNMPADPASLSKWARRALDAGGPFDGVLSTARSVPRGVWMPLDASMDAVLHHAFADQQLAHIGLWVLRHHRSLATGLVERAGLRADRVRHLVAFGDQAATRARDRHPALADRILTVPPVGVCDLPVGPKRVSLRRDARELFRIPAQRPVLLLSCMALVGTRLDSLFDAFKRLMDDRPIDSCPIVVILTNVPYGLHARAQELGVHRLLRVLGPTSETASILSMADALLAPIRAEPDAFALGTTGRFVADGVRAGIPVLAVRGAPGADLVSDLNGSLVDGTPDGWVQALGALCDGAPPAIMPATDRAAIGIDHLAARLLELLLPDDGSDRNVRITAPDPAILKVQ